MSETGRKTEIAVELESGVPAELPAQSCLRALKAGASYHELLDRRHPLGIYSISVNRIAEKVTKCSVALERCWQLSNRIDYISKQHDLLGTVVDYLELSLYAAAEHVDDVETMATSFFQSANDASKSPEVRALKHAIKPLRDRISSLANVMKHAHARFRLYLLELDHDGQDICLYGFFLEGFKDGAVGPHPILHGKGETIISATAFLWGILVYIGQISAAIERFLVAVQAVEACRPTPVGEHPLRKAVIACARLPLYSFDDEHPFKTARLVLGAGSLAKADLLSGIYGSIANRWSKSENHRFGGTSVMYAGDGVTRSFKFADPKQVQISHWD